MTGHRRPVSTVILMPSGFLYQPTDRRAVRSQIIALGRRARLGDPAVFRQAVEHVAAPGWLWALRSADPQLAGVLALARAPLPALEEGDAEPGEPQDERLPQGWPAAGDVAAELADLVTALTAAGPAGWTLPAPSEILNIDCDVAGAEGVASRMPTLAPKQRRKAGEEALTLLTLLVPPPPTRPAPRRTRRTLLASSYPRGRGRFRVNVARRTVVDRAGRRVPGVEVARDGTLVEEV